jgi:hypothetical protein
VFTALGNDTATKEPQVPARDAQASAFASSSATSACTQSSGMIGW